MQTSSGYFLWKGLKGLLELRWGDILQSFEDAAEGMDVLKSKLGGDLCYGHVGETQQVFRTGNAKILMVLNWCRVMRFTENVHEVGLADVECICQFVQCYLPIHVVL